MTRIKYFFYPSKIKFKKIISQAKYYLNHSRQEKLKIIFLNNLERAWPEEVKRAANLLDKEISYRQLNYIYERCLADKRWQDANRALDLFK